MRQHPPAAAYVAFEGERRIAAGNLQDVVRVAKDRLDWPSHASILIFDTATGEPVGIDFRGKAADVEVKLPTNPDVSATAVNTVPFSPRGPGRPKLGVVGREVTLLPSHWEWLAQQPGGASVALRRLVDEARRRGEGRDRVRQAQGAAYRFMSAMAGDKPHYEEAIRALLADQPDRFEQLIAAWPRDVRDFTRSLAKNAFRQKSKAGSG